MDPSAGRWVDTIAGRHGSFPKGYGVDVVGNGERVPHFDGYGQHANMGSKSSAFGPAGARTAWTVEAWVRPDTLRFPRAHRDGYVQWMGKGTWQDRVNGNREWLARMYRDDTPTGRYGWVSGYTASYNGGTGLQCGQAYREGAVAGEWLHFVYVTRHDTRKVALWINGVQSRGWVNMDAPKYATEIRRGNAPLLVGTSNYDNWFQGAVAKLAFYTYQLGGSTIANHFRAGSSWLGDGFPS